MKLLSKSTAINEKTDDKKSFMFSFSLDALNGVDEDNSEAVKKKSKPKKKKKKTAAIPKLEETDNDEVELETLDRAIPHRESDIALEVHNPFDVILQKQEDTVETAKNNLIERSNTGASCSDEATETKSKKRKKKKTKVGTAQESEKDEDIEFLVREINLLNASQMLKTSSPNSSLPVKSDVKAPSNNRSSVSSKKTETASTSFSFKSHKDPELSEEQRSLFRYGNGKNLVAIGPPKARDPIWKLPPPPGLTIPTELGSGSNHSRGGDAPSTQLSHCSPFSFGFGF